MPEYQFGREVTVKLPEPQYGRLDWYEDGSKGSWGLAPFAINISKFGEVDLRTSSTTKGIRSFNSIQLKPSEAVRLASWLIAAADYAEGGENAPV